MYTEDWKVVMSAKEAGNLFKAVISASDKCRLCNFNYNNQCFFASDCILNNFKHYSDLNEFDKSFL